MPIPTNLREKMATDTDYQSCALYGQKDHTCSGRITKHHAVRYGGKNIQTQWAIIPLCANFHGVDQFQDNHVFKNEIAEWVAFSRSTEQDLLALTGETKYSELAKCANLFKRRALLIAKHGVYERQYPPAGAAKPEEKIIAWHALGPEQQATIKKCIEFHIMADGRRYTPQQMVQVMIQQYGLEIDQVKALQQ